MSVTFVQTADAYRYADMVAATSRTVTRYAQRHGFRYEQYLGVKRGDHPWMATFNRVFLLNELIDRGVTGWVCYMDADAWIEDMDFDLAGYLADKSDRAGVFTSSLATDLWWDVNAGVFLLNLSHPTGVAFAREWRDACLNAWPRIEPHTNFPQGGPDDQSILHEILAAGADYPGAFAAGDPNLINSEWASFIRQHLRSNSQGLETRIARIRDEVGRVLNGGVSGAGAQEVETATAVVEGLYAGVLGREADGGSRNPYVSALINRGMRQGVEAVVSYMIDSAEFAARKRSAG